MKFQWLVLLILFPTLSFAGSKAYGVRRNSSGRIARSPSERAAFVHSHPRPGPPGCCVVDHIIPLKRGGADKPYNMQWQTKAAAKEKDKWE